MEGPDEGGEEDDFPLPPEPVVEPILGDAGADVDGGGGGDAGGGEG